MEQSMVTLRRRIIAAIGLALLAIALPVVTGSRESIVTVVLPAAAIYWMIAREHRIGSENQRFSPVPWTTRLRLFGLFPGLSLTVILFWLPKYAPELTPWAKYSIASFSLGLVLVKVYVRYLTLRMRGALPGEGQIALEK